MGTHCLVGFELLYVVVVSKENEYYTFKPVPSHLGREKTRGPTVGPTQSLTPDSSVRLSA